MGPKEQTPAPPGAVSRAARFIIIVGDPGLEGHNLGNLLELAAVTHEKELRANAFAGIPSSNGALIKRVRCSSISAINDALEPGNIAYLAYFGHSWEQALYVGERHVPEANLCFGDDLHKGKFAVNAQIRLFGCKAGRGANSIAEQLHQALNVVVYAYSNPGGSLFTQDRQLGHGFRAVTQADVHNHSFKAATDTWMVPSQGTATFRVFR